MKFRYILANIVCLILICVLSISSCLAWSNSTYTNKNNSIVAGESGLTLSYKDNISSDAFTSITSVSLLELSEDTTYYIKSVPNGTSLYYALKITKNDDENYSLGYISSSVEIPSVDSTIISIANNKTQYTTITIKSDNSITSSTSDSDPTIVTNGILIQPDSEEDGDGESDVDGTDGTTHDLDEIPDEDGTIEDEPVGNDTGGDDSVESQDEGLQES